MPRLKAVCVYSPVKAIINIDKMKVAKKATKSSGDFFNFSLVFVKIKKIIAIKDIIKVNKLK